MTVQGSMVEIRNYSFGNARSSVKITSLSPIDLPISSRCAFGFKISSTYSAGLSCSFMGRLSSPRAKMAPTYLSWIFNGSKKDEEGKMITKCSVTKDEKELVNILNKEEDDNMHEAHIRPNIVPPNEIDVGFDNIGALEETKKIIYELVILPLKRPELFRGGLLKPCRGILLFGPPGTGKTMLAKAIAKESGAKFINVSSSTIFDCWVGTSERNLKGLFTLAAKVAPTVIFVDEIDSMLGKRTSKEHEVNREVKNEFMSLWDGLKTAKNILVLGATNRPFDLDEAIIRRFERRILVDLPCKKSREYILEKILSRENVENMDYEELANMTEGYTGSDLKNLCVTAAYYPLRELLEEERRWREIKKKTRQKSVLRALKMDDIKQAKTQVSPSLSANGSIMEELQQWNNMFGEGGSRSLK